MFYCATAQAVLLYGSMSWNLMLGLLVTLKGFNVYAARRITGMMPWKRWDGESFYPHSASVLKADGMCTITNYIGVRQATVANYIIHRPIFEMTKEAERRRGTAPHPYWRDQEIDLGL